MNDVSSLPQTEAGKQPVSHGPGPPAKIGVLLANLGTPDAPDAPAVRRYLKEFLTDPRVIEHQGPLWDILLNGAILRVRTKQPTLADQLAVDYRKADLQPRHRAMLDYAVKLAVRPAEVDEHDLERLRDAGFTDEEIWDIGAVTALFALSNRMAHLLALHPNDEFYVMGRIPKDLYRTWEARHNERDK